MRTTNANTEATQTTERHPIIHDYELTTTGSCFIFKTDLELVIDTTPFEMAGGDILEVGDKFTAIDTKGSAGNPPVLLSEGWYQEYNGKVHIMESNHSGDRISTLLLFSAFTIDDKTNALEGLKHPKKNNYMAYKLMSNGTMLYINKCCSSRVVQCKSIRRLCH